MSERSISQHFEYLGAPLVNIRWSWGAYISSGRTPQSGENPPDGIILRIWQDRCATRDGTRWARITHHEKHIDSESLGWKERLEHVEEIKAGSPSFFIMCRAEDPNASTREIASFDDQTVFIGGEVTEHDNDIWVALVNRLPVTEYRKKILRKV